MNPVNTCEYPQVSWKVFFGSIVMILVRRQSIVQKLLVGLKLFISVISWISV